MADNCLIQLSDCHIGNAKNNANLQAVVEKVQQFIASNECSEVRIVISGDLTNNGTLSEYLQLQHILSPLRDLKIYAIAGNHDNVANMSKVFTRAQLSNFEFGAYNIQLIQSKVEGAVFGNIDIQTIDNSLNNSILITHHPIIDMQSEWDDEISINNKNEVRQCIDNSQHIRMICFGHAHEEKSFNMGSVEIHACPSTSYQFGGKQGCGFNIYELDNAIKKTTIWV